MRVTGEATVIEDGWVTLRGARGKERPSVLFESRVEAEADAERWHRMFSRDQRPRVVRAAVVMLDGTP